MVVEREATSTAVAALDSPQQLMKAGLLDEVQIHLVPILLGDGRRLFEEVGSESIEMERTRLIEGPGVRHVRFRIAK